MSYAPGSESAHMFHLSHFHRLVRFCWFGLVVGGVCWVSLLFLLTTDQPVRSSYQPMTIIAYLLDCHCRYDERSNVQKKKLWRSPQSPERGRKRGCGDEYHRKFPTFKKKRECACLQGFTVHGLLHTSYMAASVGPKAQ